MANAIIKEEFKQTAIAYGNSGLPLGARSQEEINDLALLAHRSQDVTLLSFFKTLPTKEELTKAKVEAELSSRSVPPLVKP